jgi:hypothetical protein
METETFQWFRLAAELCMPVDECQDKTDSFDFHLWNIKFDHVDWKVHTKLHYLLARIAFEVRQLTLAMAGKKGAKMPAFTTFLDYLKNSDVTPIQPGDLDTDKDFDMPEGQELLEPGQPLNEKWEEANRKAKQDWAPILAAFKRMGVEVTTSGGSAEDPPIYSE